MSSSSSQWMTSARMKPRSKSVWMTPAHCGRLPAGPERPGPALLLAGGEERAQAEQVVGGVDEPGQRALAEAQGLEHLGPLARGRAGRPRPRAARTCRGPRPCPPARPRPGRRTASTSSSWSSPTLTTASTGWLVSRKYGRSSSPLVGVEAAAVERACPRPAPPRRRRARPTSSASGPVGLGRLAALLDLGLDRLEVGQRELQLDDAQVLERVGRARGRRRRRRPAARRRRRRPRGCWPGTGCPGPRPCWPPRPARRCRRTAPRPAPRCGWPTCRRARRGGGRAPWPRPRWGRGWRTRRARPARRRRPARCTATTCRRWGGRRTRTVPPRQATSRATLVRADGAREIVVRGTGEARALPGPGASLRVEVTADRPKTQERGATRPAPRSRPGSTPCWPQHARCHRPHHDRRRCGCQPRIRWHRRRGHPHEGWRAGRTSLRRARRPRRAGPDHVGAGRGGRRRPGPAVVDGAHQPRLRPRPAAPRPRTPACGPTAYAEALGLELGPVAWVAEPGLRADRARRWTAGPDAHAAMAMVSRAGAEDPSRPRTCPPPR